MKINRFAIGVLGLSLLAGAASAQNLVLQWAVSGWPLGNGWLPKVAADGQNGNVAVIDQTGTGNATVNYFDGQMVISDINYLTWEGPYDISSSGQGTEGGHAPDIAMVDCLSPACTSTLNYISNVIEVHTDSQNNGLELWYRTGVDTGFSTNWANSHSYDNGYNPAIALDQSGGTSTGTTIVEVHQAAVGSSLLWYHVGTLTYSDTSVTAKFDGSHSTGFTGYSPTVSVARGVAVLMARGSNGELWYSIGSVNATTGIIAWGPQTNYTTGYNPNTSVQWCSGGTSFGCDFMVVEVHQGSSATGPLFYRTGVMHYGSGGTVPTSIQWTPNADTNYATGCYPSVGVMTDNAGTLHPFVEVHSDACGGPAHVHASWGSVQNEY